MEKDYYRESVNRVVSLISLKTSEIVDGFCGVWTGDDIDCVVCPGIGTKIGRFVGRISGSIGVSSAVQFHRHLLR